MKKIFLKGIICIIIINITISSWLFISDSYGATEEIDSEFGEAPIIDGYIDISSQEWNKATKVQINLGGSPPVGLPVKLWVMQDNSNLYISVQIDLEHEYHNTTEFVGIIISNSSSENKEDFIDAKILQFSNISENEFNYLDYYINNSIFLNDSNYNGDGAAKLEDISSIYEFSIPITSSNGNGEDVLLDYGNAYSFNITYGKMPVYPSGIIKSTIILINIKSFPTTESPLWNIVILVLAIIIFSILGILYGFYIYRIFKLKEKIERIKR
ncbi:MAG: hypothetical protein ACFE9X_08205 [Promethearchaeota archaeon]